MNYHCQEEQEQKHGYRLTVAVPRGLLLDSSEVDLSRAYRENYLSFSLFWYFPKSIWRSAHLPGILINEITHDHVLKLSNS